MEQNQQNDDFVGGIDSNLEDMNDADNNSPDTPLRQSDLQFTPKEATASKMEETKRVPHPDPSEEMAKTEKPLFFPILTPPKTVDFTSQTQLPDLSTEKWKSKVCSNFICRRRKQREY